MILLLAVVVVGLLAMLALLALGALGRTRREEGASAESVLGGAGPPIALVAAVVVGAVVVIGLLPMALGLSRSERGRQEQADDEVESTTTTTTARTTSTTMARATDVTAPRPSADAAASLGPVVRVRADDGTGPGTSMVGGLRPGTVLRMDARGFSEFAAVEARQCVAGVCGNEVRVQLNEAGSASFLFLVTGEIAGVEAACRVRTAPCSVELVEIDGEVRAQVGILFRDSVPPPGRLEASRTRGIQDGDAVTVQLYDFPRGARLHVVLCANGRVDRQHCGRPGLEHAVTVDRQGRATVVARIREGAVGAARRACGRGDGCALAVISEDAFVRATPVTLGFRAPPGASYDGTRLAVGLGLAAVLFAGCWLLVRRTDWSPLGEEAAPEIDEAEYADLDAIVAALPPEPDLDELVAALDR